MLPCKQLRIKYPLSTVLSLCQWEFSNLVLLLNIVIIAIISNLAGLLVALEVVTAHLLPAGWATFLKVTIQVHCSTIKEVMVITQVSHRITQVSHRITQVSHRLTQVSHRLTQVSHKITQVSHRITQMRRGQVRCTYLCVFGRGYSCCCIIETSIHHVWLGGIFILSLGSCPHILDLGNASVQDLFLRMIWFVFIWA